MKTGDYVKHEYEYGESVTGVILSVAGEKVTIDVIEPVPSSQKNRTLSFSKDELTVLEPEELSSDEIKAFIRFDVSFEELSGHQFPYFNKRFPKVTITGLDFAAIVDNLRLYSCTTEEFLFRWYFPFTRFVVSTGNVDYDTDNFIERDYINFAVSEFAELASRYLREKSIPIETVLSDLYSETDNYKNNIGKDIYERTYTFDGMKRFLKNAEERNGFTDPDPRTAALYRKLIHKLSQVDDDYGLYLKGNLCFGGSAVFPVNWDESLRCLTSLFKKNHDPDSGMKIGKIYLLGLAGDTGPDYSEAFRYLSIASYGNNAEAMLLLGDMYGRGLGVKKDATFAYRFHNRLYEMLLSDAFRKNDCGMFPDVAKRMGDHVYFGTGCDVDYNMAYNYYLQARNTVNRRFIYTENPEDMELMKELNEDIKAVKSKLGIYGKTTGMLVSNNLNIMLENIIHRGESFSASIRQLPDHKAQIIIKPYYPESKEKQMMMVTYSQIEWSDFVDAIVITATNFKFRNGIPEFPIIFDRVTANAFLDNEQVSVLFSAKDFVLTVSDLKEHAVYRK